MKKILSFIMCVVLLFSVCCNSNNAYATTGLIQNGDFEAINISMWQPVGCTPVRDTSTSHSGIASLKATRRTQEYFCPQNWETILVEGETYLFSVWVLNAGTEAHGFTWNVAVPRSSNTTNDLRSGNADYIALNDAVIGAPGEWVNVTAKYTATKTTKHAIYVNMINTTEDYNIDDMSVVEETSADGGYASSNTSTSSKVKITINFNDEKNEMVPKTGYLLTPSYNIPDSRIIALGAGIVRDDTNIQNLAVQNYSTNLAMDKPSDGNPSISKLLAGARRLKGLGSSLYPILYTPAWIENPMNDLEGWIQWIQDLAYLNQKYDFGIKYWDTWNEYWWITRDDFKEMYHRMWEVIKNSCPDGMTVAPSSFTGQMAEQYANRNGTEYFEIVSDAIAFLNYCSENGLTLDVLSWHFDENRFTEILDKFTEYRASHPEVGIQEFCLEEYQLYGRNQDPGNLVVDCIRRFENGNIEMAYKGVWNSIDGLSDLISTKHEIADDYYPGIARGTAVESINRENPAVRRPSWWVMRAYAAMSGTRIGVESALPDTINGIASVDNEKMEAYALIGADLKEGQEMTLPVSLDNLPFDGQLKTVTIYRLCDQEDDGWEKVLSQSVSDSKYNVEWTFTGNDVCLVHVKANGSAPGDFYPISPDDGVAVYGKIVLNWRESILAEKYNVVVSPNADMSNPVLVESGIDGLSLAINKELTPGYYYWTVTAVNQYGETAPLNNVVYSFYVADTAEAPGRFGLYYPYNEMTGTPGKSLFAWGPASNAKDYLLIVAEDPDFVNVVAEESSVATIHYLKVRLKKDTTYYWKVIAREQNGGERPNMGPVFTFHTGTDGKPGTFVIHQPKDGESPRMTLEWEEAAGYMFYQLTVAEDPNFANIVLTKNKISVNGYIFQPGELTPGKTYYVKVTASNDKGRRQAENNGLMFTLAPNPTAPLLKLAHTNVDGTVTVYFEDYDNADEFAILVGSESGVYERRIQQVMESPYILKDLPVGKYYIAVVSVKDGLESEIYNEKMVTIK